MSAKKIDGKRQHDSAVLGAYRHNVQALKRYIRRLLPGNNEQDVDDVVQEAFLLAFRAENKKEIEQPKSFLFQVARNVALGQLRQKSRRPTDYLQDFDDEVLQVTSGPEEEVSAQQRLELHCAAIAALPPQCRKVYLLRKVYSMSYKEIAGVLEVSVSTVETHLEKGFARCKDYIEQRTKYDDQVGVVGAGHSKEKWGI